MKKYYFMVQTCLVILIFTLIGKNTLPTRIDIENLEVVEIIGLDTTQKGVRITAILKDESGGQTNSKETSAGSENYRLISVESTTYSQTVDVLRSITDKYISLSHVKYYIVGDTTAQNSLRDVVDYLARTDDLESNAKLFISEDYTAQEFLKKVIEGKENIVNNIDDKESDIIASNYTVDITVLNIVDTFLQDKIEGLVPYISIVNEKVGEEFVQKYYSIDEKSDVFGFVSVGILKDMKVVDKLSLEEIAGYNLAMGKAESTVEHVMMEENDGIVLNCNKEKYSISFDTDKNNIKAINVYLKYIANIEEAHSNNKLFTTEYFKKIEENCESQIKKNVEEAFARCFKSGIDYMGLDRQFELRHPYIHRKIKDNFFEEVSKASINVKVEINLNNTYDVMQSNKFQRGDNK